MNNGIFKNHIGTWSISNYYKYNVYAVDAGNQHWLTAEPITKGLVTRCADTKLELKILLENDVINYLRMQKRVK